MTTITTKQLNSIKPKLTPFFLRDSKITGFAVKVNPSGSIKFIAEVRYQGKSKRKTLGNHPILSVSEARSKAISFINEVRQGNLINLKTQQTLEELFEQYIATTGLKPTTIKNYRHVILFYLSDWLHTPVSTISKQMIENRFYKIRDIGISGGKPTFSQAIATMRYLSALMNYARADEIIDSNPVDVLKFKRVNRSLLKRTNYLPASKARELLNKTASETHPVTLVIHLMLLLWIEEERGSKAIME